MQDIKGYDTFIKIKPLEKGWSSDKKYYIETDGGKKLLLRIANIAEYDHKKTEFEMMRKVAALGIPMQQPVGFGVCDGGRNVYQLLTWIDGKDAEEVLPTLTETEQYALGLQAGKILRKMQTLHSTPANSDWLNAYGVKIDRYIRNFKKCGITFEGDETVIRFIENNRCLMGNRPMCFSHDDFHVGNLIISPENKLFVIDFQRFRQVEPYHAMSGLVFSAKTSPCFATGQIHGYFDSEPPEDFWWLLSLYMAAIAINALPWSIPFGQKEIDFAYQQIADILSWFDRFQSIVPTWYLKNFTVQWIDGVPFKLKAPFDFSFLSRYGKVFKVFDEQRSGNLCFGVQAEDGKRYFIKFAGAPTIHYDGAVKEAVGRLKAAAAVYQELSYPSLISFVSSKEIGGGYVIIFEWTDAECAGGDYPKSRRRFMALPLRTRMKIYEDILSFHAYVSQHGFVAIDFYDGSILYDFDDKKTVICDIDLYQKAPYTGELGRWGSASYVSPEECTPGAVMDEVTNVHTMGATAFALFSNYDRSPEKWPLSKALYDVVKRAVSGERRERQQSVRQLIDEWRAAK